MACFEFQKSDQIYEEEPDVYEFGLFHRSMEHKAGRTGAEDDYVP